MKTTLKLCTTALAAAAVLVSVPAAQAETQLRFLSQFLPTAKQYPPEKAALDTIDANGALGLKVVHNEYKALGLKSSAGWGN